MTKTLRTYSRKSLEQWLNPAGISLKHGSLSDPLRGGSVETARENGMLIFESADCVVCCMPKLDSPELREDMQAFGAVQVP